jgi:hypothetical protein
VGNRARGTEGAGISRCRRRSDGRCCGESSSLTDSSSTGACFCDCFLKGNMVCWLGLTFADRLCGCVGATTGDTATAIIQLLVVRGLENVAK